MSTEQTPKTPTPQSTSDWALNAARQLRVHGVDDGHVASVIRHHADALLAENAALRVRERKLVEALKGMDHLAAEEGWNTSLFPHKYGLAVRNSRALIATATKSTNREYDGEDARDHIIAKMRETLEKCANPNGGPMRMSPENIIAYVESLRQRLATPAPNATGGAAATDTTGEGNGKP